MKRHRHVIAWAYIGELLVSGLVFAITVYLVEPELFFAKVVETASHWSVLFGVFLTVSVGAFWGYFTQTGGEFGRWLRWRGADRAYTYSFAFPILIHLCAVVVFIVTATSKSVVIAKIALFVGIYSLLNFLTQVGNGVSYMNLRSQFLDERRKGGGKQRTL